MDSDRENMSDEEYFNIMVYLPRVKIFRDRPNHFNKWSDVDFYNRFRMSKQTARIILYQIAPLINNKTNWNHSLNSEIMFLTTLRFYASGGMIITAGDFSGLAKSTVSKVVRKVSLAICSLRDQYLKFPQTTEEKNAVALGFYNIARFPRVIGSLDCSHVKIQSPGGEMGEIYRNRKGFFSFNVQAICDSELRILNIVARWPGSSHDSNIFANSRICSQFEFGTFGDNLLVADGGYSCKSYIMTPLRNCVTNAQQRYNTAQIATRNPVERLFGVWKRRFPVLAMGLRLKLETIQSVIVATGILHNICRKENEILIPEIDDLVEEMIQRSLNVPNETINYSLDNQRGREAIIEYFRTLPE